MDTLTRMGSLVSVSAFSDSLALNWEDNSGCASRLTSVNLRLWPDGVLPLKKGNSEDDEQLDSFKTVQLLQPITYIIPKSCLRQVPRDGNLFSMTLSSNRSSSCNYDLWQPLHKCRKYILEMESQYSSSWTGPSSFQTIFTSITQGYFLYYPV